MQMFSLHMPRRSGLQEREFGPRGDPPSEGGPAENLYTKSERLLVTQ
jgi:hypothetical protein